MGIDAHGCTITVTKEQLDTLENVLDLLQRHVTTNWGDVDYDVDDDRVYNQFFDLLMKIRKENPHAV